MTDDEKQEIDRKAFIQCGLLPVTVPTAVISISQLFNAAALSTLSIGCLAVAAALSVGVLAYTAVAIYRSLATDRNSIVRSADTALREPPDEPTRPALP